MAMRKLLSAGLYRSSRHPVIFLLPLLNFLFGLLFAKDEFYDSSFFIVPMTSIAVFAALSLGREHGEGTLRNKVATGHPKGRIFLSECFLNSFVALVLGVFFCLGVLAMVLILGNTVITVPAAALWYGALIVLCFSVALSVLLTTICMLVTRWAITVIVGVLLVFALMGGAFVVGDVLRAPPTYEDWITDETGEDIAVQTVANKAYVGGAARAILTALQRTNPWGQIFIATDAIFTFEHGFIPDFDGADAPDNFAVFYYLPLYSLGLAAVSGAVGWLAFRRKDLK